MDPYFTVSHRCYLSHDKLINYWILSGRCIIIDDTNWWDDYFDFIDRNNFIDFISPVSSLFYHN